jgi:hypothetical protein
MQDLRISSSIDTDLVLWLSTMIFLSENTAQGHWLKAKGFWIITFCLAPMALGRPLDVQIRHVEGVVFDKLAAWFDLVSHQNGKYLVCLDGILNSDLKEHPLSRLRVHCRFPKLFGIHFPQSLVALNVLSLLCPVNKELQQLLAAGNRRLFFSFAGDEGLSPR